MTNSDVTADLIITAINHQELLHRRQLHGRDLNDYHPDLAQLRARNATNAALELLHQIIAVTHTLPQYDDREPDPYWPELAAQLHIDAGQTDLARTVLEEWLTWWPAHRTPPKHHASAIRRARANAIRLFPDLGHTLDTEPRRDHQQHRPEPEPL